MKSTIPRRPEGSGPQAIFAQAVWDQLFGGGLNFVDSPSVKWSRTTRGISARSTGGEGGGNNSQTYRVKSVTFDDFADYNVLVCRTWDGTTEGDTDVLIAKPFDAQWIASETIAGLAVAYTYSAGPDGLNAHRQAVATGINEQQIVVPYWIEDGLIRAAPINYSGILVDDADLKLMEISARCWAKTTA